MTKPNQMDEIGPCPLCGKVDNIYIWNGRCRSKDDTLVRVGVGGAGVGFLIGALFVGAMAAMNLTGFESGVIAATEGAWQAKYDEDTKQWLVWEMEGEE